MKNFLTALTLLTGVAASVANADPVPPSPLSEECRIRHDDACEGVVVHDVQLCLKAGKNFDDNLPLINYVPETSIVGKAHDILVFVEGCVNPTFKAGLLPQVQFSSREIQSIVDNKTSVFDFELLLNQKLRKALHNSR